MSSCGLLCSAQGDIDKELSNEYSTQSALRNWRKHRAKLAQDLGITAEYSGYTSRHDVKLVGVPKLATAHTVLNFAWAKRMQEFEDRPTTPSSEMRRGLFANLSQSLIWHFSSVGGSTLCASSAFYSFEQDCILDGTDMMELQGFGYVASRDRTFSSTEKRTLAGESFHLPSYGTVVFAFYLNPYAPWWKK